jgi:hypothetical protein
LDCAVVAAYLTARTLFVSIRGRRERELANLLDDMAAHIVGSELA